MPIMKIPDSVLDKIRCRCGQYLSKIPINIQDGESICKDCTDEQAPTPVPVAQNTPYEALASLFAFPCQYKLHGCPKYVEFNKLENHESECTYRIYECPVNLHSSCNWKGTVSQLYEHYKDYHPELHLESPTFTIKLDEDHETYRMYKVDGVMLLLQSKCAVDKGKLWFNMVCFKQADDASHLDYNIKLNNTKLKPDMNLNLGNANPLPITCIQMVPEKCIDVSIPTILDFLKQPESIECHWTIDIRDELKNSIKNQQKLQEKELFEARNECIRCSHCRIYMVPPIFRCNYGHVTCADCKGYYNNCKTCQKNDVLFIKAVDLEELSRSEPHYCRWNNCRKEFSCAEIREHEQICLERVYNCPRCYIWSGTLANLVPHFNTVHPTVLLHLTSSITFSSDSCVSAYVIAHREIFKVFIDLELHGEDSAAKHKFRVDVWYLGFPDFVNHWEYKVTTGNSENSISLFSRNLNHQSSLITVEEPKQENDKPSNSPLINDVLAQPKLDGNVTMAKSIFGTPNSTQSANQNTTTTVTTSAGSVFGLPSTFGSNTSTSTAPSCFSVSNAPLFGPVSNAPFGSVSLVSNAPLFGSLSSCQNMKPANQSIFGTSGTAASLSSQTCASNVKFGCDFSKTKLDGRSRKQYPLTLRRMLPNSDMDNKSTENRPEASDVPSFTLTISKVIST